MADFKWTAVVNAILSQSSVTGIINTLRSGLRGVGVDVPVRIQGDSASKLREVKTEITSVGSAARAMGAATATSASGLAKMGAEAKSTSGSFNVLERSVGATAARIAIFGTSASVLYRFSSVLKQSVHDAIQFERSLIRVAQVQSNSISSVKGISEEVTRLATTYGVSATHLVESSRTLRQAGLSFKEVETSLQAIAKADLSGNFTTMERTVSGSISIMKQFGVEAKDLEKNLSSINEVAGRFGTSADDVLEAVKRVGAVFKTAGGDINEVIALFASVKGVTREPTESIATGLRTIFARIQKPEILNQLRALGVELRHTKAEAEQLGDAGLKDTFVGPLQAVQRLSQALSRLRGNDPRFIGVAEQLGGTRQVEKILPLLQNATRAQDAYNVAVYGSGSLTRAAAQAQDSFVQKLSRVRQEFDALIRKVTESSGFKSFTDNMIRLTEGAISLGNALKPLVPLVAAFAAGRLAAGAGKFFVGSGKRLLGFSHGGVVPGQGNTDSVPANLTPGEFVVKKSVAQSIGYDKLHAMNDGGVARYADGGIVKYILKANDILHNKYGVNFSKGSAQVRLASSDEIINYGKSINHQLAGIVPDAFFHRRSGSIVINKNLPPTEMVARYIHESTHGLDRLASLKKGHSNLSTYYSNYGDETNNPLRRASAYYLENIINKHGQSWGEDFKKYISQTQELLAHSVQHGLMGFPKHSYFNSIPDELRLGLKGVVKEKAFPFLSQISQGKGLKDYFSPLADNHPINQLGYRLPIEKFAFGGDVTNSRLLTYINEQTKSKYGLNFAQTTTGVHFAQPEKVLKAARLLQSDITLAPQGFYDPSTRRVVVSRKKDILSPEENTSLIHELIHSADNRGSIYLSDEHMRGASYGIGRKQHGVLNKQTLDMYDTKHFIQYFAKKISSSNYNDFFKEYYSSPRESLAHGLSHILSPKGSPLSLSVNEEKVLRRLGRGTLRNLGRFTQKSTNLEDLLRFGFDSKLSSKLDDILGKPITLKSSGGYINDGGSFGFAKGGSVTKIFPEEGQATFPSLDVLNKVYRLRKKFNYIYKGLGLKQADPSSFAVSGDKKNLLYNNLGKKRILALAGVPQDASGSIEISDSSIEVGASGPKGKYSELNNEKPYELTRTISQPKGYGLAVRNENLDVHESLQQQGIGSEIYLRQLRAAHRFGVGKIDLTAFGNPDAPYNGYYVWPTKFGVNGNISKPNSILSKMEKSDNSAVAPGSDLYDRFEKYLKGKNPTVRGFLRLPGGNAAWNLFGETFEGELNPLDPVVWKHAIERAKNLRERRGMAEGGYLNDGGSFAFAKGGSVTDTVPALLTPGEFVFSREAVNRIGPHRLHSMNRGVQGYAKGGLVRRYAEGSEQPVEPFIGPRQFTKEDAAREAKANRGYIYNLLNKSSFSTFAKSAGLTTPESVEGYIYQILVGTRGGGYNPNAETKTGQPLKPIAYAVRALKTHLKRQGLFEQQGGVAGLADKGKVLNQVSPDVPDNPNPRVRVPLVGAFDIGSIGRSSDLTKEEIDEQTQEDLALAKGQTFVPILKKGGLSQNAKAVVTKTSNALAYLRGKRNPVQTEAGYVSPGLDDGSSINSIPALAAQSTLAAEVSPAEINETPRSEQIIARMRAKSAAIAAQATAKPIEQRLPIVPIQTSSNYVPTLNNTVASGSGNIPPIKTPSISSPPPPSPDPRLPEHYASIDTRNNSETLPTISSPSIVTFSSLSKNRPTSHFSQLPLHDIVSESGKILTNAEAEQLNNYGIKKNIIYGNRPDAKTSSGSGSGIIPPAIPILPSSPGPDPNDGRQLNNPFSQYDDRNPEEALYQRAVLAHQSAREATQQHFSEEKNRAEQESAEHAANNARIVRKKQRRKNAQQSRLRKKIEYRENLRRERSEDQEITDPLLTEKGLVIPRGQDPRIALDTAADARAIVANASYGKEGVRSRNFPSSNNSTRSLSLPDLPKAAQEAGLSTQAFSQLVSEIHKAAQAGKRVHDLLDGSTKILVEFNGDVAQLKGFVGGRSTYNEARKSRQVGQKVTRAQKRASQIPSERSSETIGLVSDVEDTRPPQEAIGYAFAPERQYHDTIPLLPEGGARFQRQFLPKGHNQNPPLPIELKEELPTPFKLHTLGHDARSLRRNRNLTRERADKEFELLGGLDVSAQVRDVIGYGEYQEEEKPEVYGLRGKNYIPPQGKKQKQVGSKIQSVLEFRQNAAIEKAGGSHLLSEQTQKTIREKEQQRFTEELTAVTADQIRRSKKGISVQEARLQAEEQVSNSYRLLTKNTNELSNAEKEQVRVLLNNKKEIIGLGSTSRALTEQGLNPERTPGFKKRRLGSKIQSVLEFRQNAAIEKAGGSHLLSEQTQKTIREKEQQRFTEELTAVTADQIRRSKKGISVQEARLQAEEQVSNSYRLLTKNTNELSNAEKEQVRVLLNNKKEIIGLGSTSRALTKQGLDPERTLGFKESILGSIGLGGLGRKLALNGRLDYGQLYALSTASSYLGAGAESFAGTAQEAIQANRTGKFYTGKTTSGILGGAAAGAIFGSQLGLPHATAIGAGLGAAYGAYSSITDAQKELQEVRIDLASRGFSDQINNLANKKGPPDAASLSGIQENLTKTKKELGVRSEEKATNVFSGFRITDYSSFQKAGLQNQLGSSLPAVAQVLRANATELGKNSQGGGKNLKQFEQDFLNGAGGFNREMVHLISSIKGIGLPEILKDFAKTALDAANAEKARLKEEKSSGDINRSLNTLQRVVNNIESATLGTEKNRFQISTLQDVSQGGLGPVHFSDLSAHVTNTGNPNSEDYARSVNTLAAPLGTGGKQFVQSLTATNQIEPILHIALANVLNQQFGEETSFGARTAEQIRKLSPKGSQNEAVKRHINLISSRLDLEPVERLRKEAAVDVSRLTQRLIEPEAAPARQYAGQAAKAIQDSANFFSSELSHIAKATHGVVPFFEKVQQEGLQVDRRQAVISSIQAGRRGDVSSFLSLSTLEKPYNTAQERLSINGGLPGGSFSPEVIGEALRKSQEKIPGLEKRANDVRTLTGGQGKEFEDAVKEFSKVKTEAAFLEKALKHLGDAASRSAGAQEKLASLQSDRTSRLSFGRNVLTADSQQLSEINRGLLLTSVAKQNGGDVRQFALRDRRAIFSTLEALGDSRLAAFGGVKASDLKNQFLSKSGFAQSPDDQKKEGELQQTLLKYAQDSQKASGELAKTLGGFPKQLLDALLQNQKEFFDRLGKQGKEQDFQTTNAELARVSGERGRQTERKNKAAYLAEFGITDDSQISSIKANETSVSDFLAKSQKAQGLRSNANLSEGTTQQLASILTKNHGKENEQQINQEELQNKLQELVPGVGPDNARELASQYASMAFRNGYAGGDFQQENIKILKRVTPGFFNKKASELEQGSLKEARNNLRGSFNVDQLNQLERGAGQYDSKKFHESIAGFNETYTLKGLDERIAKTNKSFDDLGIALEKLAKQLGREFVREKSSDPVKPDHKARGGPIGGSGRGDIVPAMLEPGEFVLRRDAVQAVGLHKLHELNQTGRMPHGNKVAHFAAGGVVGVPKKRDLDLERTAKEFSDITPVKGYMGQSRDNTPIHEKDRYDDKIQKRLILERRRFNQRFEKNDVVGGRTLTDDARKLIEKHLAGETREQIKKLDIAEREGTVSPEQIAHKRLLREKEVQHIQHKINTGAVDERKLTEGQKEILFRHVTQQTAKEYTGQQGRRKKLPADLASKESLQLNQEDFYNYVNGDAHHHANLIKDLVKARDSGTLSRDQLKYNAIHLNALNQKYNLSPTQLGRLKGIYQAKEVNHFEDEEARAASLLRATALSNPGSASGVLLEAQRKNLYYGRSGLGKVIVREGKKDPLAQQRLAFGAGLNDLRRSQNLAHRGTYTGLGFSRPGESLGIGISFTSSNERLKENKDNNRNYEQTSNFLLGTKQFTKSSLLGVVHPQHFAVGGEVKEKASPDWYKAFKAGEEHPDMPSAARMILVRRGILPNRAENHPGRQVRQAGQVQQPQMKVYPAWYKSYKAGEDHPDMPFGYRMNLVRKGLLPNRADNHAVRDRQIEQPQERKYPEWYASYKSGQDHPDMPHGYRMNLVKKGLLPNRADNHSIRQAEQPKERNDPAWYTAYKMGQDHPDMPQGRRDLLIKRLAASSGISHFKAEEQLASQGDKQNLVMYNQRMQARAERLARYKNSVNNNAMLHIRPNQPTLRYAEGGMVPGFGSGDTVPAMLTPGEAVLTKDAVRGLGGATGVGQLQHFAEGGVVGSTQGTQGGQGGQGSDSKFISAVSQYSTSTKGFVDSAKLIQASFSRFDTTAKALTDAMKSFPNSIELKGVNDVHVTLNGADVLTKLQPLIQSMIAEKVEAGVKDAFRKKIPDA